MKTFSFSILFLSLFISTALHGAIFSDEKKSEILENIHFKDAVTNDKDLASCRCLLLMKRTSLP